MGTIITIFLLWMIQCLVCCIIHILNNTNKFPTTFLDFFTKFLNIIWVIINLKNLRGNGRQKPF